MYRPDSVKAKLLRAFITRKSMTTSDICRVDPYCITIMRRLQELRHAVRDYGCVITEASDPKRTSKSTIYTYKFVGSARQCYNALVEG